MKQALLITLLFFSPLLWTCLFHQGGAGGEVCAQRHEIDSLIKLNAQYSTNDNKKINILNALAEQYTWVKIDSALNYSNEAIALAQKLNNKTELVAAYNNKAAALNHLTLLDEEEKVLQTALAISKATNNKNGIADCYLNLCLLRKGDERKKLIEDAISLFTQTGNKTGLGKAWVQLGGHLMFQNPDSALSCFNTAIDLLSLEGHDAWVGSSINTISFVYLLLGNLDSTLSIANSIVKICIAQGNVINASSAYCNIGNYYYMKSEYVKAVSNYLKALTLAEQSKSVWAQSANLGNIGAIYQLLKDYDKALFYLTKAKEASIGAPENLINNLSSIGDVFQLQHKYDSAQVYLENALNIALKTNNQVRLPDCYRPLAELAIVSKDFTKAFNYLNLLINCENKEWVSIAKYYYYYLFALAVKNAPDSILVTNNIKPAERNGIILNNLLASYKLIKEQHLEFENKDILLELSRTYEQQSNISKAYYYFKEYVNVMDSVAKTDNLNSIAGLQMQYDSEKQEQQIVLLNKDKELQQENIEKQKATRNALIGGVTLMLLLAGVTYNRYRLKQKANNKIENTLAHLKNTQEQLVQQGKLAALGKMTSEVAMEIQNPLHDVKVLSSENELLVEAYINSKTDEERNQILDKLEINFDAITQHGKMADGIVKNVLMQSRR